MALKVQETAIPDVKELAYSGFHDDRGGFWTLFARRFLAEAGLDFSLEQVNRVVSHKTGTVRALHYQTPPYAQAKIVMVTRGEIYDVAVDLRPGSAHFGRYAATTLAADTDRALFIPRGFAHGYCTLSDNSEVIYLVDNVYAPAHEAGVYWADPELAIPWPVSIGAARLSERDRHLPVLKAAAAAG